MNPIGWWTARSAGLVAYLALWITVFFGVTTSSRGGGGWLQGSTVAALHRVWSTAVVIAVLLHVGVVVVDPASTVRVVEAVLPVGSGPVALGVLAAWGLGAVWGSTKLRKRLSQAVWRAVHATAFGAWLLALAHGVLAGSDTGAPAVLAVYLGTSGALLAAVIQRLALAAHTSGARGTTSGV